MKVLIACEYSGRVRDAFTALGHDAMSCDLLPTDAPGKHYQGDIMDVLDAGWDLMIAHPPCTYLSVSGMHWTTRGLRDPMLTEDALDFVQLLMDAPIEKIAIENPISVISSRIRKPDQIIQPWMFGENASKKTCLWLKNLPRLVSSEVIPPVGWEVVNESTAKEAGAVYKKVNGTTFVNCNNLSNMTWGNQTPSGQNNLGPSDDRWKIRSETYKGVAKAFAKQWSKE
jgi:hypothetical protein